MSGFNYCMLLANIFAAAAMVRTEVHPLVLLGFSVAWFIASFVVKFVGW